MRSDRPLFVYVLAAMVGVVVAHVGDYLAVFPHAHTRHAHLAETGHHYWPAASGLAGVAGVVLLGFAVSSGMRRGRSPSGRPQLAPARLALFQVVLFVGIEALERVPSGLDAAALVRAPEFVVGVLLQFVVAALVCRLARTVERIAATLAGRRSSRPLTRGSASRGGVVDGSPWAALACVTPLGSRAPPCPAF